MALSELCGLLAARSRLCRMTINNRRSAQFASATSAASFSSLARLAKSKSTGLPSEWSNQKTTNL
eukprot:scaffold647912_cov42-Prasinocladus_malaysianus.AAC.1